MVGAIPAAKDGARGARGESGPPGPVGPEGEVGPMPRHEWRFDFGQAQLRFERPGVDGRPVWGQWSEDLRGPPGGGGGFGGTTVIHQSGGGGTGNAAGVPLHIAAGETFTAPANQQTLFAMPILVEGILDIEGFLVEVN